MLELFWWPLSSYGRAKNWLTDSGSIIHKLAVKGWFLVQMTNLPVRRRYLKAVSVFCWPQLPPPPPRLLWPLATPSEPSWFGRPQLELAAVAGCYQLLPPPQLSAAAVALSPIAAAAEQAAVEPVAAPAGPESSTQRYDNHLIQRWKLKIYGKFSNFKN